MTMIIIIRMLFLVFFILDHGRTAPIVEEDKKLQEIKPDYKVIKYTYSRDNDTDVMDQEVPELQIIPLDFLCEFCQVVILKLKERQATEPDFEEKIKSECKNSSDDASSLCDVINRVNLEILRKDDPKDICTRQNMCKGVQVTETGPPGVSPSSEDVKNSEDVQKTSSNDEEIIKQLGRVDKTVNATLNVEDISPY